MYCFRPFIIGDFLLPVLDFILVSRSERPGHVKVSYKIRACRVTEHRNAEAVVFDLVEPVRPWGAVCWQG